MYTRLVRILMQSKFYAENILSLWVVLKTRKQILFVDFSGLKSGFHAFRLICTSLFHPIWSQELHTCHQLYEIKVLCSLCY